MKKKLIKKKSKKKTLECEQCKVLDESVLQNLIMIGFKICKSCQTSKTIFPV